MSNGAHLTHEGFEVIIKLRETLNEGRGRKRKYELKDIITEVSPETTRKTVSDQSLAVDDLETMI